MIRAWAIDLDDARALAPAALATLAREERERAERFRFDRTRDRWLAGRVALRRVLARELDADPATIAYRALEHGKPALAGRHAGALEFNASHSGSCGLVGISRGPELGVDVEEVVPLDDLVTVAEHHFAREELERLLAMDDAARVDGFYRIWTRKEAYIKAIGTGLGHALDRFAVTDEESPCRFIHLDGDAQAAAGWSLIHLRPGEALGTAMSRRFVGAVAVPHEGAGVELRAFDWGS